MTAAENAEPEQEKSNWQFRLYLVTVFISGVAIVGWGIFLLPHQPKLVNLVLLALLATAAEISAIHYSLGQDEIGLEVGTAVSMAALPFYPPQVVAVIGLMSSFGYWLYRSHGRRLRERRWDQLAFNFGMHTLAIMSAGLVFKTLSSFSDATLWIGFVWVITAICYDQFNLALLGGLFRLLNGKTFSFVRFWKDNRWAMVLGISLFSVGGFILSRAVLHFDTTGIIIFFLPIGLSALSFQLYIRHARAQMRDLERIVSERTSDLQHANERLETTNGALALSNQKLFAADQTRNRFLAVLSHDMRTPLTGIMLYSQMLERTTLTDEKKKRKIAGVIQQNAELLIELVDNLLEIEKLENETLKLCKEYFDLDETIQQVTTALEPHAIAKDITLVYLSPHRPIIIRADGQMIRRVVANLVSNAIKYTPEGGAVDVSLQLVDEMAQISVQDSGYGIPAEQLPLIFNPYHRVKSHQGKASGTGLGLSIVRQYVEAHAGEITVDSEVGVGSHFRVLLPIATHIVM